MCVDICAIEVNRLSFCTQLTDWLAGWPAVWPAGREISLSRGASIASRFIPDVKYELSRLITLNGLTSQYTGGENGMSHDKFLPGLNEHKGPRWGDDVRCLHIFASTYSIAQRWPNCVHFKFSLSQFDFTQMHVWSLTCERHKWAEPDNHQNMEMLLSTYTTDAQSHFGIQVCTATDACEYMYLGRARQIHRHWKIPVGISHGFREEQTNTNEETP